MRLDWIQWDENNELHIARHGVLPDEVEQVVFDQRSLVLRTRNNSYAILGRSESGRHLAVIIRPITGRGARVITAWEMSDAERRRFRRKQP